MIGFHIIFLNLIIIKVYLGGHVACLFVGCYESVTEKLPVGGGFSPWECGGINRASTHINFIDQVNELYILISKSILQTPSLDHYINIFQNIFKYRSMYINKFEKVQVILSSYLICRGTS